MRFQVLSHAGLMVNSNDTTLLTDPWIVGSCYWRSWWNYPPVSRSLVNSLKPDFIYLTHIHWDHFQGPSLRKFPKTTQILVPKGNYGRIKRDLNQMGYHNIRELRHGQSVELSPGFKVTSYQFGVFLDSALVIEADGVTILNANDAKFMGGPLKQIVQRHAPIDFTLRSHSSANSRLCYEITDAPETPVDDIEHYIHDFAEFAKATGARYAVPFASNHCHLHRDAVHFNEVVQTPLMVEEYFRQHGIDSPHVKVMVSGDSWSSETGFDIPENDYFSNRQQHLREYAAANEEKLEKQYRREEKATVRLADMEAYFGKLFKATPWFLRRPFKNQPITYVLKAGERQSIFQVDLYKKTVTELDSYDDESHPTQIHTSAFIMRQCLKLDLFSHLAISKLVKYRVTSKTQKVLKRLNLLFNLMEYDWLPMHRAFRPRVLETYALRWREIGLYAQLLRDLFWHRELDTAKYLYPMTKSAKQRDSSQNRPNQNNNLPTKWGFWPIFSKRHQS